MKFAAFAILASAAMLFSAQVPEPVPLWASDRPLPPSGTNYFYVAESGIGESEAEAKEEAWAYALKNSMRGAGSMIISASGEQADVNRMSRRERCVSVLRLSPSEYKVYVLFKIKKDFHGQDDLDLPDAVKCTSSDFEKELGKYNSNYSSRVSSNVFSGSGEKNRLASKKKSSLQSDKILSVYFEINETTGGEETYFVLENLQGLLMENGVEYAENKSDADFSVLIDASIKECKNNEYNVFCWAKSTIAVKQASTGKTTRPRISEGKGGGSKDETAKAIESAYAELAKSICQKIIEEISK